MNGATMKKIILITLQLIIASSAYANSSLFEVKRAANGQLDSISIQSHAKSYMTSEAFIDQIKESIDTTAKGFPIDLIEFEGYKRLSKDEKKAYNEARLLLQHKSSSFYLDDKNMKLELDKIIELLTQKNFFKLLASPHNPDAFDFEIMLIDSLELAIDAAQKVLGSTPVFDVLEFLVDEYFESLKHQRAFYQNALLAYVNSNNHNFSSEEVQLIKSSVFYSRIAFYKTSTRKNAKKNWPEFGLKSEKKAFSKCKPTSTTSYHDCFQFEKTNIMNLVDKNNSLSKKVSKAYDYKKPAFIGQIRWLIVAIKLALKFVPAPGFAKTPVKSWLESFYINQRKTEGLLYMSVLSKNETALAQQILKNTANPLLND